MLIVTSDTKEQDWTVAELPPSYQSSTATPPPPLLTPSAPENVKPTNHLFVNRDAGNVRGTYVIDPRIKIPQPMLPPVASEELKNMTVRTRHGNVDVEIFVVGDGDHRRKVEILLECIPTGGYITAKLHASNDARPVINLKAQTAHGGITVHVPRTFRGPVTVRTPHGQLHFAGELSAAVTTFNEVDYTHRCFIGDFSDWADHPENWVGDELNIETSIGNVKLRYDVESESDDTESRGKGRNSTLLGRLLRR
ncbi:hypothetical protein B0H19DRAFT_986091 [Mycena capillaripes]|nr:hypothetical protein B0H19DRAFT_986091 [Mycena capillaripes]